MKKAIITGITGQDGSYLAEFLLEKGYEVHGIVRRASNFNTQRIDHIYRDPHDKNSNLYLHFGDLTDETSLLQLIKKIQPDEFYNLGAQSHVKVSFDVPVYTGDVTGLGTMRVLELLRQESPKTKFYQASSSEMYGKVLEIPQKETTPFYPRSPYGVAKVYSFWATVNYRESYGMHTSNGILFNHESPRRGGTFVTKKITRALARIKKGKEEVLFLGNLDAKRDWGYAKDYVEAMWLMLQQPEGDDFVISTNETHTVREFCELAAEALGFDLAWRGEGLNEIGYDKKTNQEIIKVDEKYFRPAEVDLLIGDNSKAKEKLGWAPKTSFKELVKLMVEEDLKNE